MVVVVVLDFVVVKIGVVVVSTVVVDIVVDFVVDIGKPC